MSTIRGALHFTPAAKWSAPHLVCVTSTLVPAKPTDFAVPHIQDSILIWLHLDRYWRYVVSSMPVILHILCQIQPSCSCLRYYNSGRGKIQRLCNYECSGLNIQLNVSQYLLQICRYLDARYTTQLQRNTAHISSFSLRQLGALTNQA
jgi:hypothetical protein